jgi:hypothetical protein
MDNQNNRRKRKNRYNYLDKKGTVQTRHDYIETDYIKGVKNDKGELVIRPMTDDEKAWLSQFIAETEHGNINRTKEIKDNLRIRTKLVSERFSAKRKGNVDEIFRLEKEIEQITGTIEQLRENCNNFYTTEEQAKEIYERDNARRRDVYNTAKISDNLVLYDINEYDKFSTEAYSDVDPENIILEHLHYTPKKKK